MANNDAPKHPSTQTGDPSARRQFLKKSLLASTPVIMTLANRPVWAGQCSISGMLSGNLSGPKIVCQGLSPGYWGQHPFEWNQYGYYAGSCTDGTVGKQCTDKKDGGYGDDGTKFHDPTKGFAGSMYGSYTMMQVIQMGGTDDRYQLGAHAVCALLNAAKFGAASFGYTEAQIRDMWQYNYASNPEQLKRNFEMLIRS